MAGVMAKFGQAAAASRISKPSPSTAITRELIARMHFAFGHGGDDFSAFEKESVAYTGAWYAAVWEIARERRQ